MTKHQYERIMNMLLGILIVLIGFFVMAFGFVIMLSGSVATCLVISIPGFIIFLIGIYKSLVAWGESDYPGELKDEDKDKK